MSYQELYAFDRGYGSVTSVCGIDEAGRGPLAGPVFAAAVVLRPDVTIPHLNDSKKLSEKRREEIFEAILGGDLAWYGVGAATPREIDDINILQATFLAMRRAYDALAVQISPEIILVDGNRDPHLPCKTELVIKGDANSAAIAAASVIAKVSRDRYMLTLHEQYPQYEFNKHKGYGTAAHYAALEQFGLSPVHRTSFLKKLTGEL